jgi:hypothetical protein
MGLRLDKVQNTQAMTLRTGAEARCARPVVPGLPVLVVDAD